MKRDVLDRLETFTTLDKSLLEAKKELLLYTIEHLLRLGIEPTFPFIAVGACRMFPQAYALSSDFNDIPDARIVDLMLSSLKDEITVSPQQTYRLTPTGKNIVLDVSARLRNKAMHKTEPETKKIGTNTISTNYSALQLAKPYSEYLVEKKANMSLIWEHFGIEPDTQTKELKKYFTEVNAYANMIGDKTMNLFTKEVLAKLNENL